MQEERTQRKVLTGFVVSDKMDKTIVVSVERRTQHPLYKRVIKQTKRYKAHDENEECREGDKVRIMQTRPLSKEKSWRLYDIIERAE